MKSIGQLSPCKYAEVFGTGYSEFKSPHGIDGLVKITGTQVDLLSVIATKEGSGYFRSFIIALKSEANVINVWAIHNDRLADVLTRYGFVPVRDIFWVKDRNEWLDGMQWVNPEQTADDQLIRAGNL